MYVAYLNNELFSAQQVIKSVFKLPKFIYFVFSSDCSILVAKI